MTKAKPEVVKPPVLFGETQTVIKKIEELQKIKVLCYWNSVNGSICQNDVSSFYEIIKDWYYRTDERRYIPMNDNSSWYKVQGTPTKFESKAFQIR